MYQVAVPVKLSPSADEEDDESVALLAAEDDVFEAAAEDDEGVWSQLSLLEDEEAEALPLLSLTCFRLTLAAATVSSIELEEVVESGR